MRARSAAKWNCSNCSRKFSGSTQNRARSTGILRTFPQNLEDAAR